MMSTANQSAAVMLGVNSSRIRPHSSWLLRRLRFRHQSARSNAGDWLKLPAVADSLWLPPFGMQAVRSVCRLLLYRRTALTSVPLALLWSHSLGLLDVPLTPALVLLFVSLDMDVTI